MRSKLTSLGLPLMAASSFGPSARGQATFTNNTISGTIRFSNVNPIILGLLNAPNDEGMSNLYVSASSLPPESRTASTDFLPTASRTSTTYQITVDSDSAGIRYQVTPRIIMLHDQRRRSSWPSFHRARRDGALGLRGHAAMRGRSAGAVDGPSRRDQSVLWVEQSGEAFLPCAQLNPEPMGYP